MPPEGDVFGLSETRSLPPPPESSSSSGDQEDAPSERRNMRKRAPPRTRATRWRTPKITSSSRSEEHTSELQSRQYLVCRLLLEKKKQNINPIRPSFRCVIR